MKYILLIHVLGMAVLTGLLLPELLVRKKYHAAESPETKLAFARLHMQLSHISGLAFWVVLLAGIGLMVMGNYPWFNFRDTLWLAIKQCLAIGTLIWVWSGLPKMRRIGAALMASAPDAPDLSEKLAMFESVMGIFHRKLSIAWIMAILGVLRI